MNHSSLQMELCFGSVIAWLISSLYVFISSKMYLFSIVEDTLPKSAHFEGEHDIDVVWTVKYLVCSMYTKQVKRIFYLALLIQQSEDILAYSLILNNKQTTQSFQHNTNTWFFSHWWIAEDLLSCTMYMYFDCTTVLASGFPLALVLSGIINVVKFFNKRHQVLCFQQFFMKHLYFYISDSQSTSYLPNKPNQ